MMILREAVVCLEAASKNWILIIKAFFIGLTESKLRVEFEILRVD